MKNFSNDDPNTEKEFGDTLFEEAHGLDAQIAQEEQEAKSDPKRPKVRAVENRERGD